MANSTIVGILRAILTAQTADFTAEFKKAVEAEKQLGTESKKLGDGLEQLTPKAKRLVDSFQGNKFLYNAKSLAQAVAEIGGVSKLTAEKQAFVNREVSKAIEQYTALGQKAPAHLIALRNETDRAGAATSKMASAFGQANNLLGLFGASLSIGALVGFTKQILGAADALVKLSDKTGLSIRDVQLAQRAADDAGNSVDDVSRALTRFQIESVKATPTFIQALKDINLQLDDLRGLNGIQQLDLIGKGLQRIEDPAKRAAIAFELGGKAMVELIPTLLRGFDQAGDAVGLLSESVARDLDKTGDDITKAIRIIEGYSAAWLQLAIDVARSGPVAAAQARELAASTDALAAALKKAQQAAPPLGLPAGLRTTPTFLGESTTTEAAEKDLNERIALQKKEREAAAKALAERFKDEMRVNEQRFELSDKIEKEMLDSRRALEEKAATEREKIAQKSAEEQLKTFLELNKSLISLDDERTRQLLAANPPGSGIWKQAGEQAADTMGTEIKDGLKRSFEDIPHFLTSSVLHSGSFINGLKALGVGIADAIAEPLLKELGKKLASAAFWKTVLGIGGGTAAKKAAGGGGLLGTIGGVLLGGISGAPEETTPSERPKQPQPRNPGIVPLPPADPNKPLLPGPGPISNLAIRPMQIPDFAGAAQMLASDMTGATAQSPTPNVLVNNNFHVQTINEQGIREFVYSDAFTRHLGGIFENNHGFVTTSLSRGQQGIR